MRLGIRLGNGIVQQLAEISSRAMPSVPVVIEEAHHRNMHVYALTLRWQARGNEGYAIVRAIVTAHLMNVIERRPLGGTAVVCTCTHTHRRGHVEITDDPACPIHRDTVAIG